MCTSTIGTVRIASAGVDHHRVELLPVGPVDALAHPAFVVGLEAHDLRAELLAESLDPGVDLRKRDRSVLLRIALAEHVEVDAVQHEDFHRVLLEDEGRNGPMIAPPAT